MLIKALIALFFGIAGYPVGYGGRFKIGSIRKGSRLHRVLGGINLVLHCFVASIALVLPPLTGFSGRPLLAYGAVTALVVSLFLYRLTPLSLRVRIAPPRGKRAKPIEEQERTRWPYAWTCGVGYLFMYAYVLTIFPLYW